MAKRKGHKVTTKHYTEQKRSSNANPTKNRDWSQVLRKIQQFPLHYWHPSCYSSCKSGAKSWM